MTPDDTAWFEFVKAAKEFSRYLDQWEKFKFETPHGPVYVSISREDPYPDSFSLLEDEQ
jgi:hypothetical protein